MVKREFSELPQEYQAGCRVIETQCQTLLNNAKINFDALYWDNLNLHSCYLYVKSNEKTYTTKFGKMVLIHATDPTMAQNILVRLKGLVRKIKSAK